MQHLEHAVDGVAVQGGVRRDAEGFHEEGEGHADQEAGPGCGWASVLAQQFLVIGQRMLGAVGEVKAEGGDGAEHDEHDDDHGEDARGGGVAHLAAGGVAVAGGAGRARWRWTARTKSSGQSEAAARGDDFHGVQWMMSRRVLLEEMDFVADQADGRDDTSRRPR